MRSRSRLSMLFVGALASSMFVSCSGGDDDDDSEGSVVPVVDCTTVTVPKFSEVTTWTSCTPCHQSTLTGPDRSGAPPDINFDQYDSAKAHAMEAAEEVATSGMPLPPHTVTEEQKQSLYAWAQCDTPQ